MLDTAIDNFLGQRFYFRYGMLPAGMRTSSWRSENRKQSSCDAGALAKSGRVVRTLSVAAVYARRTLQVRSTRGCEE